MKIISKVIVTTLVGTFVIGLAPVASANWVDEAVAKIAKVKSAAKRAVLQDGLRFAVKSLGAGLSGFFVSECLTSEFRRRGYSCPDAPWWMPGPVRPAFTILTCAQTVQ